MSNGTKQKSTDLDYLFKQHEQFKTNAAFKIFFESSTDLMAIVDTQGRFLNINPAWEKVIGYTIDEILYKPFTDFVHPDDLERSMKEFDEEIKGKEVYSFINRYLCKDGTIRWLDWRSSVNTADKITYAVARDISVQYKAEEVFRETEARFHRTFDLPLVGAAITSADKGWIAVNSELLRMLGYTKEELYKKTWTELTHPEDLSKDIELYNRVLAGEIDTYSVEKRFIRKNGEIIWTIMSAGCVRKENGEVDFFAGNVQDITERKKAELLLEESENRYRRITDVTDDLIVRFNNNLEVIDINSVIKKYTNVSAQEVSGKNLLQFDFVKDISEKVIPPVKKVFETGSSIKETLRLTFADKEYFFQCFFIPEFGIDGKTETVLSIARDITGIQKAKETKQKQAAELENIIKGANLGTWEWNVQTGDLKYNERWAEIIGYTLDELEPLNLDTWRTNTHPDDLKIAESLFEKLFRKEIPDFKLECRLKHKDGRWIWVLDLGKIVKWTQDGKPLIAAGIHHDITDIKQAENLVAEQEKLYRGMFDTHDVIKFVFDPVTFKMVDANKAAIKFYGYNKEEFLKLKISDINTSPETIIKEKIDEALRNNEMHFHFKHRLSSGELREVEVYSSPIQIGNKTLLFSIIFDVTEKNRIQRSLLESEENLRTSNAEKDKLFSIIAHDLRGPLGSFMNLTELMSDSLPTLTAEEIGSFLNLMKNSTSGLYDLLDNLLEWSRMKRGMIETIFKYYVLLNSLEPTLKMASDAAGKKDIKFTYDIPKDLTVHTDEKMLNTIVRNFAANAVKFTPRNGNVSINAVKNGVNEIVISVRDSGIGMNKDLINNLFNISVNTGRKGTDNEPSSGLGLKLCKEFAEKINARIEIASEENKGSTFSLILPVYE